MIHATRKYLALILILLNGVASTNKVLECPHDSVYIANNDNRLDNWQRNQEIYISPYELNHKQKDFVIIDIRTKQLFDSYHITGSFNLPRDVLTSKSIFKQKNILLVGKGNDYKQLETLQAKLVKQGFKQIHILDGGMNFWKSKIKSKKLSNLEYSLVHTDHLLSGDSTNWKIINTAKNLNLTGQFSNTGAVEGAANPFSTIERKDIGVSLTVTPHIYEGNQIVLDITQEVSSLAASATTVDVITNKRTIETSVMVPNNGIIVLGGLIDESIIENIKKVPLLGDIPVIRNLFRHKKKTRVKRNLMVFIHPVILDDNNQTTITNKMYEDIRNQQLKKFNETEFNKGKIVLPDNINND
ncbi:MAG: hypothetical protein L3J53_06330 [Proteobacteria bacterium]|nr:hypothetical protein [Pseudomonadota bacterium]